MLAGVRRLRPQMRAGHLLSTLRPTSSALRVPSGAQRGTPSDVAAVLPILSQLSRGALRGTPGWVPSPPPGPGLVQRKRAASWLEITYPFASDPELAQFYQARIRPPACTSLVGSAEFLGLALSSFPFLSPPPPTHNQEPYDSPPSNISDERR